MGWLVRYDTRWSCFVSSPNIYSLNSKLEQFKGANLTLLLCDTHAYQYRFEISRSRVDYVYVILCLKCSWSPAASVCPAPCSAVHPRYSGRLPSLIGLFGKVEISIVFPKTNGYGKPQKSYFLMAVPLRGVVVKGRLLRKKNFLKTFEGKKIRRPLC